MGHGDGRESSLMRSMDAAIEQDGQQRSSNGLFCKANTILHQTKKHHRIDYATKQSNQNEAMSD